MKSGLFGYISRKITTEEQIVKRNSIVTSLAVAMQERGANSLGIAAIKDTEVAFLKKMVNAYTAVHTEEYKKILLDKPQILIGVTNTYQTYPTELNLQPYDAGISKIVGTHDGVLFNRPAIWNRATSDAEAFVKSLWISANDYKKAFAQIKGDLTGAWWSEREKDRIFLIQSGYPISFVTVKELNTIFYCSSIYSLEAAVTAVLNKKMTYSKPEMNCVYAITDRFAISKDKISISQDAPWIQGTIVGEDIDFLDTEHVLSIDNGILSGCAKCKDDIFDSQNFYWNATKQEVRCVSCGEKSRPKQDWIKFSEDDYSNMIQDVNWHNTIYKV